MNHPHQFFFSPFFHLIPSLVVHLDHHVHQSSSKKPRKKHLSHEAQFPYHMKHNLISSLPHKMQPSINYKLTIHFTPNFLNLINQPILITNVGHQVLPLTVISTHIIRESSQITKVTTSFYRSRS